MKDRNVIISILCRPFPKEALKERDGGRGQKFKYIEGHTAINRLNEATDNNWNFEIIEMPPMIPMGKNRNGNEQYLITVRGRLTIPGLGSRDDVGIQMFTIGGGEDLYKGAVRDCLKRCASNFGMALELYGEDYEAPPTVLPETKRQLASEYQRVYGQMMTRETWMRVSQEQFGKSGDDVLDSEAQVWLTTLKQQPNLEQAPTEEATGPVVPEGGLVNAVKRGRKAS